jgi:hypothetical protein
MKDRLKELRKQIEMAIQEPIDTPSRKRHLTYARAVYFKIGREQLKHTYDYLGSTLNRDHATAIHSINVVFPFAMQEERFKTLYDVLKVEYKEKEEELLEETLDTLNEKFDLLEHLQEENKRLKEKVEQYKYSATKFGRLLSSLDIQETDEAYEKLKLFVKVAIKSRVYR